MKRIVLVHGWEGYPKEAWFPWFKKQMELKGFGVEVPQMPNPDNPRMDEWVSKLAELVGSPDRDTYLIGHSLGCIIILRYLENISGKGFIGGAVLVAGFTNSLEIKEIRDFFEKPVDWEKVLSACPKFTAIHSDNDPYVPMKHADIFKDKLCAKIVVQHGKGHMGGSDNMKEFQPAVDAMMEITKFEA